MASTLQLQQGAAQLCRRRTVGATRQPRSLRRTAVAKMGGFDEGADQVRRLLNRDRKEVQQFGDIGGSLAAEFDEGPAAQPAAEPAAAPSSNAASTAPAQGGAPASPAAAKPVSPFGAPAAASPFGSPAPRKPIFEPEGLRPDLPPAPLVKEPWWKKITITQIVIVLSFTLIISLMIATFFFVVKSGGVRFNED